MPILTIYPSLFSTPLNGALTIENNALLDSVALDSLSQVSGALTIKNNTRLADLTLSSLAFVTQNLFVSNNDYCSISFWITSPVLEESSTFPTMTGSKH